MRENRSVNYTDRCLRTHRRLRRPWFVNDFFYLFSFPRLLKYRMGNTTVFDAQPPVWSWTIQLKAQYRCQSNITFKEIYVFLGLLFFFFLLCDHSPFIIPPVLVTVAWGPILNLFQSTEEPFSILRQTFRMILFYHCGYCYYHGFRLIPNTTDFFRHLIKNKS